MYKINFVHQYPPPSDSPPPFLKDGSPQGVAGYLVLDQMFPYAKVCNNGPPNA